MADNVIEVDSFAERLEANQRSAKEKLAGVQRDLDVLLADEQRRIREARMWESWQRRNLLARIRNLPPSSARMLVCANCGVASEGTARDWRAFHGTEDDDSTSVVVLCPGCAEEVGDD